MGALLDALLQLLVRAPEFLLGSTSVCQIPRHFCKPHQVASRVANGGDNYASPKPSSVTTKAPALIFEAPGHLRFFKLPFALSCCDVIRRIEPREVRADDLVRTVPFETFCSFVPRDDNPAWVEHEDRVVTNAVEKESKP